MTRVRYVPSVELVRTMASAYASVLVTLVGLASAQPPPGAIQTVPGMPSVVDPSNLYSETAAGKVRPDVARALQRGYVPTRRSNEISVIDPETMKVVDRFAVGFNPQHVVPSWDLKTLWVTNNSG